MSHPSIVFVAGSRQISRLPAEVRNRLDTMLLAELGEAPLAAQDGRPARAA